jgi:hypothetical protein
MAIYNVAETVFDTSVDASRLRVMVPVDFEDITIPIPVTRNDKCASCASCIVANGRALKPLIVIPGKLLRLTCTNVDLRLIPTIFSSRSIAF